MNNFILIILDGVGIGELPDADKYGDSGSNTIANIALRLGGLSLPCFRALGLGNICHIEGVEETERPLASFGKMAELSDGKDSVTGHWELSGIKVKTKFPYYPDGFPENIISKFLRETGLNGVLGNKAASGTEIIKELGQRHLETGYPIVYTSADSVFQLACHDKVMSLERLYQICEIARRKVFFGDQAVGRVIARPFTGEAGSFKRTVFRKDYSLSPESPTVLDELQGADVDTIAVGKINDLFNHRGIKESFKTKSNREGMDLVLKHIRQRQNSFIFANLVDFDMYFGHRLDTEGFYGALRDFDSFIPSLIDSMSDTDALIISADHGNDPTSKSTDHSREYVPLLYFRKGLPGRDLGIRTTFSDVAQTVAHFFRLNNDLEGTSFL